MKIPKRIFTRIVEDAREKQGLTWRDLETAGISQATYLRALNANGANLRLSTLEAICAAVGISPSAIWAAR